MHRYLVIQLCKSSKFVSHMFKLKRTTMNTLNRSSQKFVSFPFLLAWFCITFWSSFRLLWFWIRIKIHWNILDYKVLLRRRLIKKWNLSMMKFHSVQLILTGTHRYEQCFEHFYKFLSTSARINQTEDMLIICSFRQWFLSLLAQQDRQRKSYLIIEP